MLTSEEAATKLRADTLSHRRRVDDLKRLIQVAQDEIAIHEAVLELAQNDAIISAVNDFGSSAEVQQQGFDLAKHLDAHNISIPPGVTFVPMEGDDGTSPTLRAEVRRGAALMLITWGPEIGFVGHGLEPQLSYIVNAPTGPAG